MMSCQGLSVRFHQVRNNSPINSKISTMSCQGLSVRFHQVRNSSPINSKMSTIFTECPCMNMSQKTGLIDSFKIAIQKVKISSTDEMDHAWITYPSPTHTHTKLSFQKLVSSYFCVHILHHEALEHSHILAFCTSVWES